MFDRYFRKSIYLNILVTLHIATCSAAEAQELKDTPYQKYSEADGCDYLSSESDKATFVLYYPAKDKWLVCNLMRAHQPVLPASTFKIPHALIALETSAIEDEFEKIMPDGRERAVPSWNVATSLATGMKNSTVWFYQRVAERIGVRRERYWLHRLGYGNAELGPDSDLTTFWLTGALRITAIEQVEFLERLRQRELPASQQNQDRVAAMMAGRVDRNADTSSAMHVKSGAVLPIGKDGDIEHGPIATRIIDGLDQVGWYVGWKDGEKANLGSAVFALHISMSTSDALKKRKALAHHLLRVNGVELAPPLK